MLDDFRTPEVVAPRFVLVGALVLSKEWAVLFPVVALGAVLVRNQSARNLRVLARRFWSTVPAFLLYEGYRFSVLGILTRGIIPEPLTGKYSYLVAGFYKQYLSTLVLFERPTLWATFWPSKYVSNLSLVIGVAALVAILGWASWLWTRGERLAALAAALALVELAPAMGFSEIPWPVVFNPRYLFFVTPFYALAVSATLFCLLRPRLAALACAALAVASFGVQVGEIGVWHDEGTFFQEAVRRSPDSPGAEWQLARVRSQEARAGRLEEGRWALSGFQRVMDLTRGYNRSDFTFLRLATVAEQAELLAWAYQRFQSPQTAQRLP